MKYISMKGFTIVEVMIVIAVVGILATIMIPVYRDYLDRAKVADAIYLLGGLKHPMTEYHGTWNVWPAVSVVGGKTRGTYTSLVYSGPSDSSILYVEAIMKGPGVLGDKRVRMYYYTNTRSWICSTENIANPIPQQLLPGSCR